VLIVESDRAAVEQSLGAGVLFCPGCGGELRPWGSARKRALREEGVETALVPRRSRCRSCEKTHVLLPDSCLLRRRDALVTIGKALLAKAAGDGRRVTGARLSIPPDTVRGWFRRFAAAAEELRARCWAWAHALDASLGRSHRSDRPSPTRSERSVSRWPRPPGASVRARGGDGRR